MDADIRLSNGKYLSELKVKDLQKELQKRHLTITGRKAELQARLAQFILESQRNRGDAKRRRSGKKAKAAPVPIPEAPCEVKEVQPEIELEEKSASKRRSHTRMNETFEYVDDDEEPTQPNVTVTPQGNSTASLVDATHRKSSRHSVKERQSGGDGVVTSPTETLRAQTPRRSKRTPGVNQASVLSGTPGVNRSAIISNGDLPATSAHMEQLMEPLYDVDPYMECKENREVILETKDVADAAPLMEVKPMEVKPRAVIRTPVMPKLLDSGARSSAKSSGKKKSATPRAMRRGVPLTTPVTASVKRTGTYSVSTVSSAAKSAPKIIDEFSANMRKSCRRVDNQFQKATREQILDQVALVRVDKEVVKKAEVKCHKCNFISKKPSSAKCSRDVLEGLPSSSRSIKKKERINVAEHFARQHARIFEQMETLEDRQHRLRLATPKSIKTTVCQRDAEKDMKKNGFIFDASKARKEVTENSFKFGKVEDFSAKQRQCDSRMRAGKRVISSTIPTERSTINLLATPKGVTPPIHRERVTYTPHRGAVGTFIDTTKLSDRDFELAVANGLIKARSTR
ncbi:unnamed protein product [Nippostrongylus brasiliensis]|uniref:SAP domain-containing protein n=1 Tax=Nippostrongylus brasiliensis TaxID=27835 RepID=A0A0N4YQ37_NIPBR|nr:unnamed protein product [Nippostrongylus brasiliensis]